MTANHKIKCIECSKVTNDSTVKWAIKCNKLHIGVHLSCAVQSALDRFITILFIKNFFKSNTPQIIR